MKINCLHGYFQFTDQKVGEISDFASLYRLDLVARDNYFTFSQLKAAPNYSVAGGLFLGALCKVTFQGNAWDVMRANGLVYNFILQKVVPIETVLSRPYIIKAANYFISDGLILPGSVKDDGTRVTDYAAGYLFSSMKFRYTDITCV